MAIMVVADGDAGRRSALAEALRRVGHEVHEAGDGAAPREEVRRAGAEVLVMDLWLPGKSGFEVLDELRHDPAGARLVVVALTDRADAEPRLEAYEAGAAEVLVRRGPAEALAERIDRAWAEVGAVGLAGSDGDGPRGGDGP